MTVATAPDATNVVNARTVEMTGKVFFTLGSIDVLRCEQECSYVPAATIVPGSPSSPPKLFGGRFSGYDARRTPGGFMTKRHASIALACLIAATFMGYLAAAAIVQAGQAAPPAQGTAAPQRGQGRGAAAPPAPCGPSAGLSGDLGKNVAANSRCFELRMYTVDPSRDGVGQFKGGINELHQRFREKELELFKKHGAEIIGAWQNLGEPNMLVWMLAFRDRAHREAVWAAFNADPEWTALRTKYFVPLQGPNVTFMSAADYSPLK